MQSRLCIFEEGCGYEGSEFCPSWSFMPGKAVHLYPFTPAEHAEGMPAAREAPVRVLPEIPIYTPWAAWPLLRVTDNRGV